MAEDARAEGVGLIQLPVAVMRGGVAVEVVEVVPPVHRRFVEVSPEESRRQAYARRAELVQLAQTSAWPEGWGTLEKVLIEEGLADENAIAEIGVTWREPPLNIAYRAVVNRANRLERLIELAAPEVIVEQEREALVARVAELDEVLGTR